MSGQRNFGQPGAQSPDFMGNHHDYVGPAYPGLGMDYAAESGFSGAKSLIPGVVDDWSTINFRYRDEQNNWCWPFRVRMDYLERMQRRNTTKGKVETGWKFWKRFRDKTLLERIPNSKTTLQRFWGFRCSELNWFVFIN